MIKPHANKFETLDKMNTFLEKYKLPNSFKEQKNSKINYYRRNQRLSLSYPSNPNRCTSSGCLKDWPTVKEQIVHFYLNCYKAQRKKENLHSLYEASVITLIPKPNKNGSKKENEGLFSSMKLRQNS